jgi:hypothetical protein
MSSLKVSVVGSDEFAKVQFLRQTTGHNVQIPPTGFQVVPYTRGDALVNFWHCLSFENPNALFCEGYCIGSDLVLLFNTSQKQNERYTVKIREVCQKFNGGKPRFLLASEFDENMLD